MTDLFGIRVIESEWMPPDQMMALGGDFEKPANWADMTKQERFTYALIHGATLVKGVGSHPSRSHSDE